MNNIFHPVISTEVEKSLLTIRAQHDAERDPSARVYVEDPVYVHGARSG